MFNDFINKQRKLDYFKKIDLTLKDEFTKFNIYPNKEDVFNAFKYTPFNKVKVVILGQDPYHNPNQAHGLAFSVNQGIKVPPSLRNIFKELNNDLNISIPNHGCLIDWAKQGVLLLNTVLTVRKNEPNSHKDIGWTIFTDNTIRFINDNKSNIVFILWGNNAKKKKSLIDENKHFIIESVHPSPLSASRGFFGSKPFSQVNEYLVKNSIKPIDWTIQKIDL